MKTSFISEDAGCNVAQSILHANDYAVASRGSSMEADSCDVSMGRNQARIGRQAHRLCVTGRERAFSLLELLVAVVIIGILALIIVPAVVKVKDKANAAKCVSNLRQIGVAWHLYLADNNGRFPSFRSYEMYYWGGDKGSWGGPEKEYRPLYPYLSDMNVFRCPSDVATSEKEPFYTYSGNSYVMANSKQRGLLSMEASRNRVANPGVYAKLRKPSRTIMVFEQTVRASEAGYTDPSRSWYRDNWHRDDVSNILMADGHVETFERAKLDAYPHPLNPEGYTWGWSYYSGGD